MINFNVFSRDGLGNNIKKGNLRNSSENLRTNKYKARPESAKLHLLKNRDEASKLSSERKYYENSRPISALNSKNKHGKGRSFGSPAHQDNLDFLEDGINKENFRFSPGMIMTDKIGINDQAPYQDYTRLRPKTIKTEKEQLYEDTIHLKNIVNCLKEENIKLKTRILTLERENNKLQKVIGEVESLIDNKKQPKSFASNNQGGGTGAGGGGGGENFLIVGLKKQIKDLKFQLEEREDELQNLKRNIKVTRLQELEIELKSYTEETLRLRTILDVLSKEKSVKMEKQKDGELSTLEEKFMLQNTFIEALKQRNAEIIASLKILEEENLNLQCVKEISQKNLQKSLNETKKLKKLVTEKEKEINSLKEELKEIYVQNQSLMSKEKTAKERTQLDASQSNEQSLKVMLSQKDQVISYQEKTINELRSKLQEKSSYELRDKKSLLEELSRAKELCYEIQEKYKTLQSSISHEEKRKFENPANIEINNNKAFGENSLMSSHFKNSSGKQSEGVGHEKNSDHSAQNFQQKEAQVLRRLPKILKREIAPLGLELRLRLRHYKIGFEQLDKYLLSEKILNKGYASIKDMQEILEKHPFEVKNAEANLMIARFLVEDNSDDYIDFNPDRTNEITVIKSVFKTVVGQYEIMNEAAENLLFEETKALITKYAKTLKVHLAEIPEGKTGYLSWNAIKDTFRYLEIEPQPTEKQWDYILLRIFHNSNDMKRIYYLALFQVFEGEANL